MATSFAGRLRSRALGSTYRREAVMSSTTSMMLYFVGFVTGPIVARTLGPDGRGEIAAVLTPVLVLTWLLSVGVPMAAAYHVDYITEGRLLRTAALFGVLLGLPVCGVLWLLAPTYLDGYSATTITWLRVFIAFLPLSMGVQTALEIWRRRGAGTSWNLWRSTPVLLSALGIVALALTGTLSIGTALAAYFVGNLVPGAFLVSRLRRSRGERPAPAVLRAIFPYAWRHAATIGGATITNRVDQVVLVAVVVPEQLGLYAVAVSAAAVSGPLTSGLTLAIFGSLRDEASTIRARTRLLRSVYATLAVSSGIALTLGLLAPRVIPWIFGSEFDAAVTPLRLLLPGQVAMDLSMLFMSRFYAEGRPGEATRAGAVGAVMTVIGLSVLVPRYGVNGAAATTSIALSAQAAYLLSRGVLRAPNPRQAGDPGRDRESAGRAGAP